MTNTFEQVKQSYVYQRLFNWYFKKNSLPYWCVLFVDCLICFMSGILVFWLFFRGQRTLANIVPITLTLLFYMVFNLIAFKIFRTYSGIIRYSSFVDLKRVAYAMGTAFLCVFIIHYPILGLRDYHLLVPLGTRHILAIYLVSAFGMWMMRVGVKSLYEISYSDKNAQRAVIYGVKAGGVGLAKNLRSQQSGRFKLKGFISHNTDYKGQMLMGEPVYAVDDSLPERLKAAQVDVVLVSPLRNDDFRNDQTLQGYLTDAGVHVYMFANAKEWKEGDSLSASDLREVNIEDLLPRDEIKVDMQKVGEMLTDKKILITGSAGSIGSEMVRQIAEYNPSELILIDQAETPQHDIRLMMSSRWPAIKVETIVASIANQPRMESIFKKHRPEYVFHAAAYKHVPMMEDNPSESVENNVYGTKVLADLSVKYGVKKFVMISTDKAVNPTNVMGCSKRICEIYVQSLDRYAKEKVEHGGLKSATQFVTTRFGNVLGSNGSVIPLFEKQIKSGGPVTVTDPNIIRYFMLIPEACKLVLEAGTHGHGGEIFVFDMGSPVKIADLAKRMIVLSGARNVKIEYTGLRAGEKLYEEVLSADENTLPSFHEKIRIAKVREYPFEEVGQTVSELIAIAHSYDDMAIVGKMKEMVPEFVSNNSVYSTLDEKA
ncbi:MAG: polysaccharide biosynthesis protein [Prevotella sp.]|nr:polysaccharide biosynthesis protein [Prevotella sp.]